MSTGFVCAVTSVIGKRQEMEDCTAIVHDFAGPGTHLFGIFDGHSGSKASKYCARTFPSKICEKLREEKSCFESIRETCVEANEFAATDCPNEGSTVGLAIIIGDRLYFANVGDTRIVLSRPDGTIERMSVDHKASDPDQCQEIMDKGGFVFKGRVNGFLAITRSIGDANVGDAVGCEPHLAETAREAGISFVIASDGVWDMLSDEEVMTFVREAETCEDAVAKIRDEAYTRGSKDNISVICVKM